MNIYRITLSMLWGTFILCINPIDATLKLSLDDAVMLAQTQSVDAAVALNELRTAFWEYRTYRADLLPKISFDGNLPSYHNHYTQYQQPDGEYTYVRNNNLSLNSQLSVSQNIPLTGGTLSLISSLDYSRQLGRNAYNEYMSIPAGITLNQPLFAVNNIKWAKRIEPVRYQEAKAAYIESVEVLTLSTINLYFSLLMAKENLTIAHQNLENADKLYEIALAKRNIGKISEMGLVQLKQSALQAQANLTKAQSDFNAKMFQLRAFLGLDETLEIDPVMPKHFSSFYINYQDVLQKAHENNSLAKNILRRQLEANYAVATAKGERFNVDITASVGYTGKDDKVYGAYNALRDNQIVEVGVSIPLLDWGKSKGKIRVAESNRELVLSKTHKEQIDFNQDIYLLVEKFNTQSAQLKIAQEVDSLAQYRYKTSIETFMVGQISILDLNDARSSKDEARENMIASLFYYWYYYYNIRSLALYDFQENRTLDADFEAIVKQ